MHRIVIASHNPVKIQAALQGFQRMFPEFKFSIHPISVPSGVSVQPASDEETLQGATNRASQARHDQPEADYWVGIEGGVDTHLDGLTAFAWVVIFDKERVGKARTVTFFLPEAVAFLVQQGMELGEADDIVFARTNSKQANGAVGLLTGDVLNRFDAYVSAVILALIPFKNPNLYPPLPRKLVSN
jgi:inosine/xanthosine triphosphatase